MIYVFHDNQLIYQGAIWDTVVPPHSVVYDAANKEWAVKYDRKYLRPIKLKHVPKEIKVLCLLLGIPM